jgi:hypothetical protein
VPRPALLLALWSLFVWGVRIRNAAGDVGPILLSLTFVVLAAAVVATRGHRRPTLALAGWTAAVWAVRLVDILLLSDQGAGFKAVHAALGTASIALAALAWRSLRSDQDTVEAMRPEGSAG